MTARARKTADAIVAAITRPRPRGDWIAIVDAPAMGDTAPGGWAIAWRGTDAAVMGADDAPATYRVRFGGAGGAMVAAITDDARRRDVIVAAVRIAADPATWASYANDARPGAIPSVVVAMADGTARDTADGAAIRRAVRNAPASRRVARHAAIAARAAERFGTDASAYVAPAPDA